MNDGTTPLNSTRKRTAIAPLVFLIGFVICGLVRQASTPDVATTPLQGEAALQTLRQQGSYDSLREAMTAARYNVHQDREKPGIWRGSNDANALMEEFNPEGVEVRVTGASGRSHRLGLKLRTIGYGKSEIAIGAGSVHARQNRVEIRRVMASGQLTEWYVNTASGLEHGFTIEAPPRERLHGERLRVVMGVEGDLRVRKGIAGNAMRLENGRGESVLRYEKLVVEDSRGTKLAARMGGGNHELWIELDDQDAVYPVTVDPTLAQEAYLKASNTETYDSFGYSIAISGDTVVAGAQGEDSNANVVNGDQSDNSAALCGAAYVFVRSAGVWSQQAYLKASNAGAFDSFGSSVAVSGDTIVVGAVRESSNATGVNGDQSDNSAHYAGAAYVFTRSAGIWSQQAYLKASNTEAGDEFGWRVAVSGDIVVVGTILEASDAQGINGDQGNNSGPSAGAAYVFARSGGVWSQQAYLKGSNTAKDDEFGGSVAVFGETVVVGAIGESSNATTVDGDQNNDLAYLAGAAYVFVRTSGVWSQQAYLKASNARPGGGFGWVAAISGDTAVIGTPFETSNATGVNGDQSDTSALGAGAAYVFTRSGGTWSQQAYLKASNSQARDRFGWDVAVSGETIVVSAPYESSNATGVNGDQSDNLAIRSGAAYVFVRSLGAWSQQAYLKASNTQKFDEFGCSVAVSGDTIVVGANRESSNATGVNGNEYNNSAMRAGAAYVFSNTPNGLIGLSPGIATFPGNVGAGTPFLGAFFTVNAPPGVDWTAVSNDPGFITIAGGSSGTGKGAVSYSLSPNPSNTARRIGKITAAGQVFTVLQGPQFLDVPVDHVFYTQIGKLAAQGVTLGCGAGKYCPEDSVTREQMGAFIMRARGEFDVLVPAVQRFDDVGPANPFYGFIDRMAFWQITLGCSASPPLYCPANAVLREQMAAFIIRGLGELDPPTPDQQQFSDVSPANPFYNFIDRMAALQITLGCSAQPALYCPSSAVTRAQMAAFLVRAFDL